MNSCILNDQHCPAVGIKKTLGIFKKNEVSLHNDKKKFLHLLLTITSFQHLSLSITVAFDLQAKTNI